MSYYFDGSKLTSEHTINLLKRHQYGHTIARLITKEHHRIHE